MCPQRCTGLSRWGPQPDPRVNPGSQKSQLGKRGLWSGPQAPEAPGAAKAQPPAHVTGTGAGRARVTGRSRRARRERCKARVKVQKPMRARQVWSTEGARPGESRQKPPAASPGRKGNRPEPIWGPRREAGSPATQSRPPAAIRNPGPGTATPREARNPDVSGKSGCVSRQPCSLPVSIIL